MSETPRETESCGKCGRAKDHPLHDANRWPGRISTGHPHHGFVPRESVTLADHAGYRPAPDSSPPPVSSPTTTPALIDDVTNEVHALSKASAASFFAFEDSLPDNAVAPSAPPAPAPVSGWDVLERLAREAMEADAIAEAYAKRDADFSAREYQRLCNAVTAAEEALADEAVPERVAQLVAGAREAAALSADYGKLLAESNGYEQERDALRRVGAQFANVAYNVCQRDDLDAPIRRTLDQLRREWDAAARASRPTEETDG